MANHNETGKQGEQLACDFLVENGYEILETNWTYRKAEIDILAQKGEVLAVVEVKTRSSAYLGNPQDFVKPKKIKLLTMAVDAYIQQKDLDVTVRFDIIAIILNENNQKIEHLTDAFYHF